MSVTQQMKTVVTLGGAVSPSFEGVGKVMGKTVADAKTAVRSLDSEQRKMFKTLSHSKKAASDLEDMTKEYRDQEVALSSLEGQRSALNIALKTQRRELKQIGVEREKAREEGRDVSAIAAKHEALTAEIDKQAAARDELNKEIFATRKEQNKLNRDMKHLKERAKDVDKLEDEYRDLGNEVERAAKKANAWKKAGDIMGNVRTRMRQVVTMGGAVVGMSGLLGGLATATNRATAEQIGLAKSYGMGIETFKAWGGIAGEAGLNAENTGDLVEELTNKVGEFKALGEQSAVAEVFGALGLSEAMLEGMNAAEQFEFIMKRLEGVADDQQAASLADILMGGEGNKVVTYLRNSGKSLDDLLDTHRQFNLLTSEGAEGAGTYSRSIGYLLGAVSTAWQEISGIVGGELSPEIEGLAKKVVAFARESKRELVSTLKDGVVIAKEFAVGVWKVGSAVGSFVGRIADAVGGMDNLVQIGGVLIAGVLGAKLLTGVVAVGGAIGALVTAAGGLSAVLPAVVVGLKAMSAAVMANPIGLMVGGIALAAGLIYRYWQPLGAFFSGLWSGFSQAMSPVVESLGPLGSLLGWVAEGIGSVVGWVASLLVPVDMASESLAGFASTGEMVGTVIGGAFKAALLPITTVVDALGWVGEKLGLLDGGEKALAVNSNVSSEYQEGQRRAEKARATIGQAEVASRGNTVHQKVEKIEIVAAPGQSPQEVGRAVAQQLGGYQSGALYDIPMG